MEDKRHEEIWRRAWGGGGENRQWEKKSQAKCEVAKKQLNKKKKKGGRAGAKTGEAGKRMRCCGTDAR